MPVLTLQINLRDTKKIGCIVKNKCVTSLTLHGLTELHIMNKPKNSNMADFDYSPTKARTVFEMHNCIPFFDRKILGANQVMKTQISAVRNPACCKMAHMSIWEREQTTNQTTCLRKIA